MKKIFYSIICIVALFSLTACGNKTAITTDKFKTEASNEGYLVADVTSQYSSYGYVNEATVARNNAGWQVEFYVLSGKEYATSMFNTNKATFETYKETGFTESTSSVGNYEKYSLTSGGYYMYLCRVDNTFLYLRVEENYKDDAKAFIKKLGY